MRANIRLSTLVGGANIGSLNVKNGRLEGSKTAPTRCFRTVSQGLTPTKEGLMTQSTFTHRQTALGGAE